jgi:hypothetical protein
MRSDDYVSTIPYTIIKVYKERDMIKRKGEKYYDYYISDRRD